MKSNLSIFLLALTLVYVVLGTKVKVAIIGTNDIHGSAFPALLKRSDTEEQYNYGGLPIMATLINIIKNENEGNVIYLDAGDQFQGGVESSPLISSGKIMNDFYGLLEVKGSAIGNHQFDFGPDFLFPFMSSKDSPNLSANLRSQNNKANFMPKQQPSKIIALKGGIKIGVIGLATLETPTTTDGFRKQLFPAYKFLPYKTIVINEAQKLRKNGANAVILLTHVGNQCPNDVKYGYWFKNSTQAKCSDQDEMTLLLKSLPEGTIQGVVQGHRHTVSHVFIENIPVIGNINGGYYFNVMYLEFENKKVVDSSIEGPIPVCERIFRNTGTCNFMNEEQLQTAGPLVHWTFHNKEVYPDPRVNTIFEEEWKPLMKPYFVELVENQVFLQRYNNRECELGNLITTLIHQNFTQADFTLMNIGGFRTEWAPGILQERNYYNMFPFDNLFKSFNMSGSELLKAVQILQSGKKALYQFWGIQTTVKKIIVDQSTKFQFVSAKMANGEQIDENKFYTGVCSDFLLGGGDDFRSVLNSGYVPRDVKVLGEFRDSLRQLLIDKKVIKQGTLIDPNNPRIIIQQ